MKIKKLVSVFIVAVLLLATASLSGCTCKHYEKSDIDSLAEAEDMTVEEKIQAAKAMEILVIDGNNCKIVSGEHLLEHFVNAERDECKWIRTATYGELNGEAYVTFEKIEYRDGKYAFSSTSTRQKPANVAITSRETLEYDYLIKDTRSKEKDGLDVYILSNIPDVTFKQILSSAVSSDLTDIIRYDKANPIWFLVKEEE